MAEIRDVYLTKSEESLSGADSELVNGRYNNCANRCYYGAFQAAIAALLSQGITPLSGSREWRHEFVQGQFVGELINRRHLYSSDLRDVLARNQELRETADYEGTNITHVQASRALRRARALLEAIQTKGGG